MLTSVESRGRWYDKVYFLKLHMYLRTKFQVSSIILTGYRQGVILTSKRTPIKPTHIRFNKCIWFSTCSHCFFSVGSGTGFSQLFHPTVEVVYHIVSLLSFNKHWMYDRESGPIEKMFLFWRLILGFPSLFVRFVHFIGMLKNKSIYAKYLFNFNLVFSHLYLVLVPIINVLKVGIPLFEWN